MRWDAILFSVRQGVRDPFIRWTVLASALVYLAVTGFFIWSVLPTVRQTGLITLHYNTYIGIDDVRPWPWMFFIPGVVLLVLLFDTMVALLLFQKDRLAARAVMALGGGVLALWAVGMYFLTRINL